MIPDEVVDEIRERADLVAVVSEVVSLQRSGKEYKALCPFHDERTPSFYVVPDKGFYKCFGCGEAGDAIGFAMKAHGMDFVEAARHVGGLSGVEVREVSRGEPREDPHRHFREATAFARDFFRRSLTDPETGSRARAYLEERGVGVETAERFQLGYAPPGWRNLADAAGRQGIEAAVLGQVGLLVESERAPEPYDRFRDRVIFPIEDAQGRVVAFGGRVVGKASEGVPKYVNSPESPIYTKGEILYGLARAKHAIRRQEEALLVEGYTDVVSLAAAGFENSVAALGTSLTDEQARQLSRYTRRVILVFDPDAAGLRAAFRAGDLLLSRGIHPLVAGLEPGRDPDDLLRSDGPDALRRHLGEAVDVLDRKLRILREKGYLERLDRIREGVDRLLPTLRAVRDPALRDIYLNRVAEETGVRRETLEAELEAPEGRPGTRGAARGPRGHGPDGGGPSSRRAAFTGGAAAPSLGMGPERQLLVLLVRAREWIDRALERLDPEDFEDSEHREVFRALVEDPELEAPPEGMTPGAARKLRGLLEGDPEELRSAGRVFEESVNHMRARSLEGRIQELDGRMRDAARDERWTLLREWERLRRELADLRPFTIPGNRRKGGARGKPSSGSPNGNGE